MYNSDEHVDDIFKTSDLFLVMWLTVDKPEGSVPIHDYDRRGRFTTFFFERTPEMKALHLAYINSTSGNAKFLKSLKARYDELKDIIYRDDKQQLQEGPDSS